MANEIRLSRRIAATPDEVFDAWTRADALSQWLIPCGPGSTRAQLDARVGGHFKIDMNNDGELIPHHGEYLRLERPSLLQFTWISQHTGNKRSVVTVELAAAGRGETDLTLTHHLLPSQQAADGHTKGWTVILDELVARYAQASPERATA
ncbi:MAG: SRPBCC family protein [Woeseiaceae bacterium]